MKVFNGKQRKNQMFSKTLSLYIPRIYSETIINHLDVYDAVYDFPDWVEIMRHDTQEGICAYLRFMFENLGYGTAIRTEITPVNNFFQGYVYFNWVKTADTEAFQAGVEQGNYRVYHPDQSFWIVTKNTKALELEPMEWMIDTTPSEVKEWTVWDAEEDPSLDYDYIFW
jgi:hypothetical protein